MNHRSKGAARSGSGAAAWIRPQVNLGLAFALVAALVAVFLMAGGAGPAQASTSCLPGTYDNGTGCVPADPGYFVATDGATAQTPCLPGFYQPNAGSTSCVAAGPGAFVDQSAAISQTLCSVGKYQPLAASVSCVEADAGSFVAVLGATAQTLCPVGRYQPSQGSESCLSAPAGSFVAVPGAVAATPCAVGTYQPATGSVSCIAADPGFFVAVVGAVEQTACPAGTTSLFAGAGECTTIVDTGYTFSGFSAPVDAAPTLNVVKAGQTVPLKFHVSDSNGAPVTDLSGVTIRVTSLACSSGTTFDLLEEVATGGSGLQNLGDGYYQFNWKTPKNYASSCKTMSLDLGDGAQHAALFQFRK